jgi:hypothetical protein
LKTSKKISKRQKEVGNGETIIKDNENYFDEIKEKLRA